MMIFFAFLVSLLGLQDPVTGRPEAQSYFHLAKDRAGAVRIGMSVDELYNEYGHRNTKLVDRFTEGLFNPVIEISINGKKSLIAEIAPRKDFVIQRISVLDDRFRTKEGIGIGSTLGELRIHYHDVKILAGEGGMPCARVDSLGMTFGLEEPPFYQHPNVSATAKVTSVLVTWTPK